MTSYSLTEIQRLNYSIQWLENYRQKKQAERKDLQDMFEAARARFATLDLKENWGPMWKAWRPKRHIANMLDALLFYAETDRFLQSKRLEMELALKIKKDPDSINPAELAQHQVRHQQLLEQLEKQSGSDCEELLAEIEQGISMPKYQEDDYEVIDLTQPTVYFNIAASASNGL